jgi:hypothetical protein
MFNCFNLKNGFLLNLDNELHLSWTSDNSMCEGDENETSIYDSSLEYND